MCIKSSPFKGRGRGGVCIVIIHVCFRFIEKFAAKVYNLRHLCKI